MKQIINGADFRRLVINAAANIENNKQHLNELNVFPVPDGDTGTNMSMTINAASADLRKVEDPSLEKAAKTTASAMLRGARGNSGVILSLLMRGISNALKGKTEADGVLWAQALQSGVDAAYKAVMKPAEGTILTVARLAAAKAAEAARENNHIEFVHDAAIAEAKVALASTTDMNPVLKKAGVVDAGGKGWLLALEAMALALKGEDLDVSAPAAEGETKDAADFSDFDTDDITFTYCTEFIIQRENDMDVEPFRAFLDSLGDSLVLVDDEEIIKVHVHTEHPGQAIEEGLLFGSLINMKIENMKYQHENKAKEAAVVKKQKFTPAAPEKPFGFVSVASGDGIEELFRDLGVDCIVRGGQTMNPSTDDILQAIMATPAETVFVLPNNKNIIMAAEQAVKLADRRVCVLQSRTIPQGITAMMNFDPDADFDTNRLNMSRSLDTVSTGQLTFAARDSDYEGHNIKEGDILALDNGKLAFTERDVTKAAYKLTKKLADGNTAFITLIYGTDVDSKDAEAVHQLVQNKFPNAEVMLVDGGQPVYYYIISVE